MKSISRIVWRNFGQAFHLHKKSSVFLDNKLPVLYFVNYGHSESRLKSKLPTRNDEAYTICDEVIGNGADEVKGKNYTIQSDLNTKEETLPQKLVLEQEQGSSPVFCHETIVHKYSRVPALPSYVQNAIPINIPTESDSEAISSIHRFFLGRFVKYLKKFQESLANEMPDTFHMFNTFTNGFKEFVIDFRDYIGVIMKMSLPFYDLEDLNRRELELYFNMPRQMIRVFPVVAVSSLPFAQNLALPVAIRMPPIFGKCWVFSVAFSYLLFGTCFPRYLLCYHFWDKKQRKEFPLISLRKRLFNARPVFRSMQTRIDEVPNPILRTKCQSIFFSLGSGIHPTQQQILEVKELFSHEPYHLNLLYAQHVNGLLRLYGRSALFRRRYRLREHARYIYCMDKALIIEGLEMLNSEKLRTMLILRGINPSGMSNIEMRDFLDKWIFISSNLDEQSYSLLLHLPILLAYNHPPNLLLLNS
ncbi:LETM1 domain-containing protein 1 [Armadillidium nasatum]|uniref:LETM1 domain-containing protein 1 n=1 Tax=Armadillidium nasatum TaxID=96803 RepID=A0A5N5SX64_9CRUS|nr:LETM1 domain-containing protein 1 [Armadillidium nasatum]